MRGSFSKIVKTNKSNLIKIICVLLGAVFAFTTGVVYASFSWTKKFDSGYATGAYLPNQSYQIINDTLPNGIPYNAGVNDHEVALQYSYGYNFEFYVEYALEWTNKLDTSNVILNYSNRDAWIVDNSHMYYREVVSAGTGKIPMIVGVNFTDLYDETYYGQSLTINITKVVIKPVDNNYTTSHALYTNSIAGNAWLAYKTRTSLTNAYVVCYNQTSIGSYKPTAPIGETAFMTYNTNEGATATRRLLGNRCYVGLGIYVITGSNAITLRAKVTGTWIPATPNTANIVSNTIKYNYSDNWGNETYNLEGTQTTNEIDEIREYDYEIPAHTAVYIPVVDSVEMVTRGLNTEADYTGAKISTLLELNGNQINTSNGIGVNDSVASADLTKTELPTNETTVVNVSKYMPALFHTTDTSASRTYQTQITVINNTNKKLKVTASDFQLKLFISNGNSAAKYGQIYEFNDTEHWARAEVDSTALKDVDSMNYTKIVSPYGAVTLVTEFTIVPGVYNSIITKNSKYANCDLWAVLVPTITAVETTEADDTLTLETEIVTSGSTQTAYFYAKNVSTNVLTNIKLSIQYSWFNTQDTDKQAQKVGTSEPANWGREYWKYYTKTDSTFNQVTTSEFNIPNWNTASTYYTFAGWQIVEKLDFTLPTGVNVNPGEKVLMGGLTLNNSQTYNFDNYTFSSTSASMINTSADDVQLINEASGLAYLINNSTNKSYYVRFNSETTSELFHITDGYSYYKGLIRPGQVIPVPMTAVASDIIIGSENFIEDTTGSLITQAEIDAKGWAGSFYNELKNLYATI